MRIYRFGKDEIPERARAIALGFFDGMHLGHKELLRRTAQAAKEKELEFAVFTFSSEGSIKPGTARLERTENKLFKMGETGVQTVIMAEFEELSRLGAEDFVRRVLCSELCCRLGAVGYNFRFGKGAIGTAELFSRLMSEEGGEALVLPEVSIFGKPVSSTGIRQALSEGNAEEASALLGEPYSIESAVERGWVLEQASDFPRSTHPLTRTVP